MSVSEKCPILQLVEIDKTFPGVKALDKVTLEVQKGEVHALIGENGAGKSTLMKILSCAYKKDGGEIILDGESIEFSSTKEAREKGVNVIYQELSLVWQLNAVENLFLGNLMKTKNGLVDWKAMKAKTKEVFDRIGLVCDLDVPVSQLSIGQCQLIEISRAIIGNAKIIVMDEPTSSLTDNEVEHMFQLIKDMKANGITIIYITHKLDELYVVADSITVLKDGCNACRFTVADSKKQDWVNAMVGRELANYYPDHDSVKGKPILEVKNLSYRNRVRDVSFTAHAGEIVGFAGLIGAGRTELMLSIFGALHGVEGDVFLNGKKVKYKHPSEAIKDGVALAPEDRRSQGLVLCLNITENTTLASMETVTNKAKIIDLKKEKKLSEDYIKKLNLASPDANKLVGELSGGNQQKVIIAKWLNTNAKVYIFDEPTRGIDVGAKAEIYKIMRNLAKEGNAVIMVSSEMPEVISVSDRILVMHDGKIVREFDWKEATEQKVITAAVGGVV